MSENRRKAFGSNWWAQRWIAALEALGWEARLQRGRTYARSGHVRSIDLQAGRVVARVKGSRPQPYTVRIELTSLPDEAWERVIAALGSQARYAASLLAGEMPPRIEAVLEQEGAHLFPRAEADLVTDCSCPDPASPCKHVAAVHYVLGAGLDRDPFLLFRLRGRSREALLAALRTSRSVPEHPGAAAAHLATAVPAAEQPLEEQLDRFWTLGEEFGELRFTIESPRVPEAVLKRLGSPPDPQEGELPRGELARLYRQISNQAIRSAYESGEG